MERSSPTPEQAALIATLRVLSKILTPRVSVPELTWEGWDAWIKPVDCS
jgi:hypothetical protein